jgi:hypothetical protein
LSPTCGERGDFDPAVDSVVFKRQLRFCLQRIAHRFLDKLAAKSLARRLDQVGYAALAPFDKQHRDALIVADLPGNVQPPRVLFESPVFQRIGCKLMQSQAKGLHKLEIKCDWRPLDRHFVARCADGVKFGVDDIGKIDLLLHTFANQSLNAAKRLKPRRKPFERAALSQSLLHKGLDNGKQVARSMLKLADEHLLATFRPRQRRHVGERQDGALDPLVAVSIRSQADQIMLSVIRGVDTLFHRDAPENTFWMRPSRRRGWARA